MLDDDDDDDGDGDDVGGAMMERSQSVPRPTPLARGVLHLRMSQSEFLRPPMHTKAVARFRLSKHFCDDPFADVSGCSAS
jgi:hypothetical protein